MKKERQEALELRPIGRVEQTARGAVLRLFPVYRGGLKGIRDFSHVWVFYWFHENDNPGGRSVLEVYPRKDPDNPLTGVFGTRSPLRPNLIALSLCAISRVDEQDGEILVESLDARHGSPLIDIKPYLPHSDRTDAPRLPDWVNVTPEEGHSKESRSRRRRGRVERKKARSPAIP